MGTDWPARALAAARPGVYWLDELAWAGLAVEESDALPATADLVVVGGGYTGLWTALRALEREPGRSVVVVEAGRCGQEASGRNGGFAAASLTHGFHNGLARWPEELATLDRLGAANLDAIGETVERYGIDCRFERTGELSVATTEAQAADLAETAELLRAHGHDVELLDAVAVRQRVDSPTYLAGLRDPAQTALLEPARLAAGLRAAITSLGAVVVERTRALSLDRDRSGVVVRTTAGSVRARQVVLATNAFPPLLRRLRLMSVPVYDHVLMTEPLTAEQRSAVGWAGREGVGDAANLFHYYRQSRDHRILWGGYDAVYHFGSRVARDLEQNEQTHTMLARHFFETFPQLEGLRFSHRWGGVIDTCTRFSAFFGTAAGGRVAYALGFTGLGVASTRFAGDVVLDLLAGEDSERTALRMVRERPLPFPPEPARWAGITATRHAMARADRTGRPGPWLRAMDAVGLGFDS